MEASPPITVGLGGISMDEDSGSSGLMDYHHGMAVPRVGGPYCDEEDESMEEVSSGGGFCGGGGGGVRGSRVVGGHFDEEEELAESNCDDTSIFENKSGLSDDMRFLASMPELCDITFLVGETREPVCAVKAVLGVRSK